MRFSFETSRSGRLMVKTLGHLQWVGDIPKTVCEVRSMKAAVNSFMLTIDPWLFLGFWVLVLVRSKTGYVSNSNVYALAFWPSSDF